MLPVILVVCALSALLWHWRILKWITQGFGVVFEKTMGLRGPPALATAATVFMGQVEGPIFIRSYLASLCRARSSSCCIAVGMSCVSGSTMVAYATILKDVLPNAAAHVLTASIISAPAGVLLARILVPRDPEAEKPPEALDPASDKVYESSIDALIKGTSDGLQIVLNVAATLIVFVALVAMVNGILGLAAAGRRRAAQRRARPGRRLRAAGLGHGHSAGRDAPTAGSLLGVKLVLTEFTAFIHLGKIAPGAHRRAHPGDHDLCALRLRQHRLGGDQRGRLFGAGPGAAQRDHGHGLEGDDGRLPRHLPDRLGGRRHANRDLPALKPESGTNSLHS